VISESTRQQSQQWLSELAAALEPWRLVLVSGNDLFAGVMVWTYPGQMLRASSLADLRALLTPVAPTPGLNGAPSPDPREDPTGAPACPPSAPRPIPQRILPIPADPPGSLALESDSLILLLCDDLEDGDVEQAMALACEQLPSERRRLLLVLSDCSDRQRLRRHQESGVDALCALGSRGKGRIYTALHAIAMGGIYVDPLFRQRLRENDRSGAVQLVGADDLSSQERSLLREVCRGYNGPEIAIRLGLSVHSVRRCLSQTYQRIGVRDRAQAIGWCLSNGVMELSELQAVYLAADRLPLAPEARSSSRSKPRKHSTTAAPLSGPRHRP
jgi:DNA-binding NarL/FixJ family response regulator